MATAKSSRDFNMKCYCESSTTLVHLRFWDACPSWMRAIRKVNNIVESIFCSPTLVRLE